MESTPSWACPPASSYCPHDFDTASFLLFSNNKLKELAMSLSTHLGMLMLGHPTRTMSVGEVFPISVAAFCSVSHWGQYYHCGGTCSSQQCCKFLNLYHGNVLLLHLGAKAIQESQGFKAPSPYIAYRALIIMTAGAESGPRTPMRHLPWLCAIAWVSLLPACVTSS